MELTVEHTSVITEETDLIRQSLGGSRGAFERIYRENAGQVYALCLRLLADPSEAAEALQDTFVRAWQTLGTFRQECPLAGWIHRIAVSTSLMRMRSRRRRGSHFSSSGEPDMPADEQPAPDPGSSVDLEDAIAKLPPQARAVVVLHDIEGYRHEEIAEFLSIAPGTSKAQLHRARILLKEVLQ